MIVNSTELQNNFGKYLMLAAQEDIIITRNGTAIAKLSAARETASDHNTLNPSEEIAEKAKPYRLRGKRASYEKYLQLSKNTEERYEYIDGEIYLLASPKTAHQIALAELFVIFHNWFQGKSCTPMVAPYDIELRRTPEDINIVQPDIMILCDLEEKVDEHDYYKGIPSLVVEVLSESTRSKDLIKKLDLYMSCDVKEYWIVNPINREVTVYLFENRNISSSITFKNSEMAESFIFAGLSAELSRIFK